MDAVRPHDESGFSFVLALWIELGDVNFEGAYAPLSPFMAIEVEQLGPARENGIFSLLPGLD